MRKSSRPIVEKIPFVDIRDLSKAGAFGGGEHTFPYAAFRYPFLAQLRTYRYQGGSVDAQCDQMDVFPR